MRAVARSACTWPDRTSVHQWWQHSLRLDKVVVGPDGTVQGLDSAPVVRLLAGQHLAPGARYRVDDPGLTVGEASISVDGQASVRTVHAAYRDLRSSDDTVALDLIGLDTPRSVVSSSTLRYLRWEFELHYRRDQLLSLSVDLDWLRVRVRARVLESADGDQLELRVSVRGAGLWRPTLAPLLAAVSLFAHNGVRAMADDIAQALTDVAEDPTGDPVARERRRARERALQRVAQQEAALGEAMQVFSDQLHQVEDLVDARPWWRRGRRGWRACFDEVCGPLPTESPPIPMFGTRDRGPDPLVLWWMRGEVTRRLAGMGRRHRREAIDRVIVTVLAEQVERLSATFVDLDLSGVPTRGRRSSGGENLDALLDLAWLATPWSTLRKVMNLDSDREARRALNDLVRELRTG